ncbi:GAF domain-containing sensor histidine kinase [Paucibacter sp. TC2R-5]|uniref:GAF domain-containing sensor histidine kinase n=1 Tax=Paucibacter sp. TC2R-5 TaxID=2893555 RepID=UPI0021E360DE|nr:GAF domain-containing sensor histidine kinase [Paucibacter sp. TC2R-5]MCV2360159.1 GAF domain-containing sensor histidine kinase [Paucibacter sp. TC2R-5]
MSSVDVAGRSAALFSVDEGRSLAEAALRSITLSTSRAQGEEFFRVLVRDLAQALDVQYVIAAEVCTVETGEASRTLAVWAGSDFAPNMTYSLEGTPCQNVADQTMCFHACGVQAAFPQDSLLVEMGAHSYIGMPMVGTHGKTLGILIALDVREMQESKRLLALSLLSIFAARCAAELQHRAREAELEAKVALRTHALEEARAHLVEHEKLAALGGLVAGMAHEVNTPIGVAVTSASGLQRFATEITEMLATEKVSRSRLATLASQISQSVELVERNLQRAAELMGNFKSLAVDQSSEVVTEFELADYLSKVTTAHQAEISKCGASLSLRVPSGLRVRMAAGMLAQITSNLLMNALLHGARPALELCLTVETRGRDLRYVFEDNGVGVSAEVRARMLEPFYTTRRGAGGSGLGLHIVYTLVQRLAGKLSLESRPGEGLSVTLDLPDLLVAA